MSSDMRIILFPLLAVALLSITCCSDENESKRDDVNQTQPRELQNTTNQASPAVPTLAEQASQKQPTTLDIDTNTLAKEFGVPADTVVPMLVDVKEFKNRMVAKLNNPTTLNEAIKEIDQLADEIAHESRSLPSSSSSNEPISLAVLAGEQSGPEPSAAVCRAGFLGLPPDQLSNQLKLHAVTQEIARTSADYLPLLLHARADSDVPTAADWALYAAVTDGIQDNQDFQFADALPPDAQSPPYAEQILLLGSAQNAVYRLLAIRLAPQIERDRIKLGLFYQQFANDHEEVVRRAALDGLKSANPPNIESILETFGK